MIQWEMIIGFLVAWGILYLVLRKFFDPKKGLSRKGFIVIFLSIFVLFLIVGIAGFIAGRGN